MPTGRGWTCIVTAGALGGAGAGLRVPELLEIGVALLVLVLVQLIRGWTLGRDLRATRSIHPPAGMAGSPVTVEVTVSSRRGLPAGATLVWLDPLPQALGGVHRLELTAMSRHRAAARWRLIGGRRGRFVIGPGRLVSTDPFGLVQTLRPVGSPSTLVVFPRLEALHGRIPTGAGTTGATTAASAPVASPAAGLEFFATREWRPGDDMRRIHWRSTARMAKVMVKQEELLGRDRATVVVDNRRASYAGGWEGAEAFERAVEAAASLVHHFLNEGFAVRLVMAASGGDPAQGVPAFPRRGAAYHRLLMTALAMVELAPATLPPGALPAVAARDGGGLVVLVGGMPEADGDERLSSSLRGRDALVVLTTPRPARPAEPVSHRVLHVPPGQTLGAVWNGTREAHTRSRSGRSAR